MHIRCPVCQTYFKHNDYVFLDDMNTLTHQHCYSLDTNFPITDLGTYEQVCQQHDFFKENN